MKNPLFSKTLRGIFPIALLAVALSLAVGCVGVSYSRQSFSPDGKPQEVVKARATSLFTTKSFDTLNASVASPNEQRTFSVGRYQSTPDAKSIEAVGGAVNKATGQLVKP